jgi:uncharacterized alkaline shock family protein YloU
MLCFIIMIMFAGEAQKGSVIMKLQTEKGMIRIDSEVISNITGAVATSCYGVKGMAVRSKTDGLVHLLRRESMAKGVKVHYHEDAAVSIELHIMVDNGVNLTAVSRSIMSEVKYHVSRLTGAEVRRVDVCVDSMLIG